jgi:hypothetical protein
VTLLGSSGRSRRPLRTGEALPKPLASAMEPNPVRGRRAAENPGRIAAGELFPRRKEEHLALGLGQLGERVEHAMRAE